METKELELDQNTKSRNDSSKESTSSLSSAKAKLAKLTQSANPEATNV